MDMCAGHVCRQLPLVASLLMPRGTSLISSPCAARTSLTVPSRTCPPDAGCRPVPEALPSLRPSPMPPGIVPTAMSTPEHADSIWPEERGAAMAGGGGPSARRRDRTLPLERRYYSDFKDPVRVGYPPKFTTGHKSQSWKATRQSLLVAIKASRERLPGKVYSWRQ